MNKRLEKVNSVAIVEDTGGFSGIIVAAHELGHLLGAVHDGSPPPSYLGGPGAVKCRWEDGYIMSDLRHTSKGFKWSICTVLQFHHFLKCVTPEKLCDHHVMCLLISAGRRRLVCTTLHTRRSLCLECCLASFSPWTPSAGRTGELAPASRTRESAPNSSASTPAPATASPTDPRPRARDVEKTTYVQ